MEKTRIPVEKRKCGCSGCYYENLEEEVKKFIFDISECGLTDCSYNKKLQVEMLKNYIKNLKMENEKLIYELQEKDDEIKYANRAIKVFETQFISKSKIKEMIEELEKQYKKIEQTSDFIIADIIQPKIQVLRELLEEENE